MKEQVQELLNDSIKDLNVFVDDAFISEEEGKKVFNIVLDSSEIIDFNRITDASRIINKIMDHNGSLLEDIDELEELAHTIKDSALCGLGQTAPNPVLSTLANFRDEYIAHVVDKKCPAGVCKELIKYYITDDCIGCTKCKRNCPVGAISGNLKEKHTIDTSVCIKCGACKVSCPKNAIITA